MILALDTATIVSSIALVQKDRLVAEITINTNKHHSELLMPHIADIFRLAKVDKKNLTGVAVSIGPGSFTGLRIGLATAKTLAYALSIPIVGVPTLEALAFGCLAPNAVISLPEADEFKPFLTLTANEGQRRGTLGQLFEADVAFVIDDNLDQELPLIPTLLRKRVRAGALKIIYLGSTPGLLDKGSTIMLKTDMTDLSALLESLDSGLTKEASSLYEISEDKIKEAKDVLINAKRPLVLVGPKVASSIVSSQALLKLCSKLDKCTYLPLYRGANTEGALRILGNMLTPTTENLSMIKEGKISKVLLIEPDRWVRKMFFAVDKGVDCALLSSKTYDDISARIIMPITGWHERRGHVTNLSGAVLEQKEAIVPPKNVMSLSRLLTMIK